MKNYKNIKRRRLSEEEKKNRRRTMRLALFVTFAVAVVLVVGIIKYNGKNEQAKEKLELRQKEYQAQLDRQSDLENLATEINSDEYVIKVGREKFNLSFPGEEIYSPED